ncbi:nostrin-like [Tropilaelaps mercedesae]|uniref:Nostrin-like n=1 Tax=Tropilaelaps mercedesae TaxID=418985 RepID=A0A1V9X135_9ACAR|nr:nostrin-like [Tropilaelaps mercedesae]
METAEFAVENVCLFYRRSTANAWCNVSVQMEREAETHRALALSLTEEVVKPLRNLCENQAKLRKTMECQVDKKAKIVADKRVDEAKLKRQTYTHQRDVERLHGDIERTSSDKELAKIQAKKTRAEEALSRTDALYYSSCLAYVMTDVVNWLAWQASPKGLLANLDK